MYHWLRDLLTVVGFYMLAAYCIVVEFYLDRFCRYNGLSRLSYLYNAIENSKFINRNSLCGRKLIALVTGANGTIGIEITQLLLRYDFRVICLVRDRQGKDMMNNIAHPDLDVQIVDLANLQEVKSRAQSLSSEYPMVDIIICNAGIMLQPFQLTVDGFELHYSVNLLSHAVLVDYLLSEPQGENVPKSSGEHCSQERRILFVSSITAHLGNFYELPLNCSKLFAYYRNGYHAYSATKLAISLYAEELNNELQSLKYRGNNQYQKVNNIVISLHPGCVASDLYERANYFSKILIRRFLRYFMRKPAVAAAELIALGCSDNLIGGCYYQHMVPTKLLCTYTAKQQQQQRYLFENVQNIITNL